jgi:DNA-binding NarL/FixJ family response regulator
MLKRLPLLNLSIHEVGDLSGLSFQLSKWKPDVLIIDPTCIGINALDTLKMECGCRGMRCIALQRVLMDNMLLRSYDEVISIYDTSQRITEKLTAICYPGEEDNDGKEELSVREKEVLTYVVKGFTNRQIAEQLCLSLHTVNTHRRNIAFKLQIHSPAGLTIYAIVNKLVELDDVKDA